MKPVSIICVAAAVSFVSVSSAFAVTAQVTHNLTVSSVGAYGTYDPTTYAYIEPDLLVKTGDTATLSYSVDLGEIAQPRACGGVYCSQTDRYSLSDMVLMFSDGLSHSFGGGFVDLNQSAGTDFADVYWSVSNSPDYSTYPYPSASGYGYASGFDPATFQFDVMNFANLPSGGYSSQSFSAEVPSALLGADDQQCYHSSLCYVSFSGTTSITLDQGSVSAVPIPAPLALLSFAMLGLVTAGRRKAA